MSLIKEHYQDEHGNWLPEAQAILAKATATPDATKESANCAPHERRRGCERSATPQEMREEGRNAVTRRPLVPPVLMRPKEN